MKCSILSNVTASLHARAGKLAKALCPGVMFFILAGMAHGTDVNLPLAAPGKLTAVPKQLGVSLEWQEIPGVSSYVIQRASTPQGPFVTLNNKFPELTLFNDFIGQGNTNFFYRVRAAKNDEKGRPVDAMWSELAQGHADELDTNQLITEVQKSAFDYFYRYGHPVSGLARISMHRDPDICAIGASGMGFFNLGVGIERGFITRQQGVAMALKQLRFLSTTADRFHGAFPHLLNGQTGKVIPFSKYDDGADIVETAFLIEGALFAREYFDHPDPDEAEIRRLADGLWRDVEWDWFLSKTDVHPMLIWHWSPNYGWKINLHVVGFNECQIVYVLAMASPTHPITTEAYWEGWEPLGYAADRDEFGIHLDLRSMPMISPPLFMTHYSYLGMDPRQIWFRGRTYFDHFTDFCRVQVRYADSKSDVFKGYGPLWGLTASAGPEGYSVFSPGRQDNGTLAPTAAISSMPYVPEESISFIVELYTKYGDRLWGPFGFYDSFNFTRNWVSKTYLCIDQGPIAPMIENYRTGLCWNTFMKCKEIIPILNLLNEGEAARTMTQ